MDKTMNKRLLLLLLSGLLTSGVYAQTPPADNLYDIAVKGTPVNIDADLSDWKDAQWIFLSQDSPRFVEIQGLPASPSDFSAWFAMKMDDENAYFAIRVRDEGIPMVETIDTPNLAFNYDHLSVYLGLYDIGPNASGSPHVEGAAENLEFYNPDTTDGTVPDTIKAGRSYRIAPGYDNMTSTLGPDYQLLIRALPYEPGTMGEDVQTYAGALVDTTIMNTTAAGIVTADEKGYILEWKIPFTSLAGKIAKPSREYRHFDWPLFEPKDGMTITFDADVTDKDGEGARVANRYLRIGQKPALWRDAHSFGMRGRIVDLSLTPNDVPRYNYYITHKNDYSNEMNIDGDLNDWADAAWIGLSQDSPVFTEIQGIPASPSDFSGFYSMKMDNENLYIAVRVRDEGIPMVETIDTPNLAFNYDHLSVYLGLYDIGNSLGSPHIEGAAEGLEFYNPDTTDGTVPDTIKAGRTYRIAPGYDNMESTKGADHQLLIRALPYEPGTMGEDVQTYSGALVDTTIMNTTASGKLTASEDGYSMEWKIPFASLSGKIGKPSREYRHFDWPLYIPQNNSTIVFDADLTDKDGEGARDLNRYLRLGDKPALWRDSKSFSIRGKIRSLDATGTSIDTPERLVSDAIPSSIDLNQNYPNPFNPSTIIEFANTRQQLVRLTVFNALGQEVAVLVDGTRSAGTHQVMFNAFNLSSGIYFYRLSAGSEVITRKMTLIK